MYVCIYIYIYINMYIFIYIYIYIYTCWLVHLAMAEHPGPSSQSHARVEAALRLVRQRHPEAGGD